MRTHFKSNARHADRVADAFLRTVDDVLLRDGMEDALVRRHGDGAGRFQHAVEIGIADLARGDRHHAVGIAALDVAAGDRGIDRSDLAAGHHVGFLDGALDRLHRGFDVHDDAAAHAARFVRADADHFDRLVRGVFTNQRGHLGGADVEADDEGLVALAIHALLDTEGAVGAAAGSPQVRAKPLV